MIERRAYRPLSFGIEVAAPSMTSIGNDSTAWRGFSEVLYGWSRSDRIVTPPFDDMLSIPPKPT